MPDDLYGNPAAMRDQAGDWRRVGRDVDRLFDRIVALAKDGGVPFGAFGSRYQQRLDAQRRAAQRIQTALERTGVQLRSAADDLERAQARAGRAPTPTRRRSNPPTVA